mgnify:CR=1 FL=1
MEETHAPSKLPPRLFRHLDALTVRTAHLGKINLLWGGFPPNGSALTDARVLHGNYVIDSLKYGLQRDDVLTSLTLISEAHCA